MKYFSNTLHFIILQCFSCTSSTALGVLHVELNCWDEEQGRSLLNWLTKAINISAYSTLISRSAFSSCICRAELKVSLNSNVSLFIGTFGMTYTWSVDLHKTMKYYTNYFNGIITNYPGTLTGNFFPQKLSIQRNIVFFFFFL